MYTGCRLDYTLITSRLNLNYAPQVYTGFRVAPKGAQEAYSVQADMVVYGKTLGGGLPVGVLCGRKGNMTRADPKLAARVAYVIGTFAGHPAVMGSMNAFLKWHVRLHTRYA